MKGWKTATQREDIEVQRNDCFDRGDFMIAGFWGPARRQPRRRSKNRRRDRTDETSGKRGLRTILAAGLVVLSTTVASATTYYVSNVGSDGNSGTDPSQSFKTIAKVQSAMNAGSIHAGDSVLFNRGDTWLEQLTLPSHLNGSVDAPIVLGNYGMGAPPVIDGSSARAACFYAAATGGGRSPLWSYVTIDGFECRNTTQYAVLFNQYAGGSYGMPGIVVQNMYIHNTGPGACAGCGTPNDDGNYRNQLMFNDENQFPDGAQFLSNVVNNCGGHNCMQLQQDTGGPLIRGNRCGPGWVHNCIDLKAVVGAVVDSNVVTGPALDGAALYNENTEIVADDVTWTRNVVVGAPNGIECELGTKRGGHQVVCRAYNNTLYLGSESAFVTGGDMACPKGTMVTFDIRNNVVDTKDPVWQGINCNWPLTWDYNDDCASQASCSVSINGSTFTSLSALRAAGYGAHDEFRMNPLYADAGANDFHLQPGSSLIDAGCPNLVFGMNDIGAYDYNSGSPTAGPSQTPTAMPTPTAIYKASATPTPTAKTKRRYHGSARGAT